MKTIPLAKAKATFSGLVDEVAERDERVIITKRGRPAAVLMSHEEAASLEATLEIMSDPEFYAEILRNARALDRGEGRLYRLDELFGEEAPARGKRPGAPASKRGGRRAAPPARAKEEGAGGARRAAKRSRAG